MGFDIVGESQIKAGEATDAYFERVEDALDSAGHNPTVVAEVTADQFPTDEYEVFAGLPDVVELLSNIDAELDVTAIPEGRMFDGGPVMNIRGPYRQFARFETALLGFLSQASGIATNARKAVSAANGVPVLSFGARHVNPSLGAVVERNALIGGVDGISCVAAESFVDEDAVGTMPHALMLAFGYGEQEQAWNAFNDGVPDDVPRLILCDTFTDERDEVIRAVEELGDDIDGVRLDTTGSRRGNFKHIIKEVQWALDECGRNDVDIYVSGGLTPSDLYDLSDVVFGGFGVGGYIASADPVDFSLDIINVEGEPISKRGKLSGIKDISERSRRVITPTDVPSSDGLHQTIIEGGDVVDEYEDSYAAAAERAEEDATTLDFDYVPTSE